MKSKRSVILFTIGVMGLAACAHHEIENEVSRQTEEQPSRPMHGGVAAKGLESIESSTSLSKQQKSELTALEKRMIKETFAIQEETSKLKGVLFETLTASPYNVSKMEVVKGRLVELNNRKMASMFDALTEAEKIIGAFPPEQKQELYREIFFQDLHRGT